MFNDGQGLSSFCENLALVPGGAATAKRDRNRTPLPCDRTALRAPFPLCAMVTRLIALNRAGMAARAAASVFRVSVSYCPSGSGRYYSAIPGRDLRSRRMMATRNRTTGIKFGHSPLR